MAIKTISSLANPRVKDAVGLRDHRHRVKQGRFLIDGAREFLQALSADVRFVELFVCIELCKSDESQQVINRLDAVRAEIWHVTPNVFEKMAFGKRHDGVLAVAEVRHHAIRELSAPPEGLIAVIEGLEKPGNVGAVLRSADGAGVSAVVVADPRTDLYNPNCIRASMGTLFTQQVCEATPAETLAWLRARRCHIFAATVDATRLYTEADFRGPAAIVLGSEASGLSAAWRSADVTRIRLPMRGTADSLNVSATAAVLFYEAARQRGTVSR